MIALHWTARRCDLADALATLDGSEHTLLVATPTSYTVAVRGADGRMWAPGEDPWPLPESCFQLTAFDGSTELRWLRDGSSGRAVWLAEDSSLLPGPPGEPVLADLTLPARSVLWGEAADGSGGGFSAWSDARVGTAHYPTAPGVARHERACLDAVEYVAHDAHGNAHVVERRLVGIVTVDLAGAR